jgi:hypothetical protein
VVLRNGGQNWFDRRSRTVVSSNEVVVGRSSLGISPFSGHWESGGEKAIGRRRGCPEEEKPEWER